MRIHPASKSFKPSFRHFGQVWVRYRLVRVEPREAAFKVAVSVQFLRLVTIRGGKRIGLSAGIYGDEKGQPMGMGRASAWFDLADILKYGSLYCTTTFVPSRGSPRVSALEVELDIAWGPRESQIIKVMRENADLGAAIGAAMPTDRARKPDEVVRGVWPGSFAGTFQTFTDLSRKRYERIKRLVPEPVGPSKNFNFCTGVTCPGSTYASSRILRYELLSVSRMGINVLYASGQKWPRRIGLGHLFPDRYYTAGASPARYWVRRACPNHPDVPARAEATMKMRAEHFAKATEEPKACSRIFGFKIGDEIGVAVGESHVDTCEDCQHRFKEYLRGEGFGPALFGKTWDQVRWTSPAEGTDAFSRLLRYYSELFLSANTAYIHAELVRAAQRYYDAKVPVGYNVNPTPIMGGMDLDWFEMERHKGITSQWMEVIGSIQPGGSSYLADLAWVHREQAQLEHGRLLPVRW